MNLVFERLWYFMIIHIMLVWYTDSKNLHIIKTKLNILTVFPRHGKRTLTCMFNLAKPVTFYSRLHLNSIDLKHWGHNQKCNESRQMSKSIKVKELWWPWFMSSGGIQCIYDRVSSVNGVAVFWHKCLISLQSAHAKVTILSKKIVYCC